MRRVVQHYSRFERHLTGDRAPEVAFIGAAPGQLADRRSCDTRRQRSCSVDVRQYDAGDTMRPRPTSLPPRSFWLTVAIFALSGCAADMAGSALDVNNASPTGPPMDDGRASLYRNDLVGAQAEFDRLRAAGSGYGAAGYAVTSLLLLPYSPAVTRIITAHLGASDAIDRQGDVLWGDRGLVYFIARGVAWEDTPQTAGIKTLLVDRLPWSRQQLDSVDGFVDGLDRPVALLATDLAPLADELASISDDLTAAVEDAEFSTFFLPGQVFYDTSLDLTLGKSELSLLRGVLRGAEAGLRFFAAYDHGWTLERALGTSVWEPVIADPEDPDHVVGAEVIDYRVAHVNESLGRSVAESAHLDDAAAALEAALVSFAEGLDFGISQTTTTTLTWRNADAMVASQYAEFVRALAASMGDATELPYTEPPQTAPKITSSTGVSNAACATLTAASCAMMKSY